MHQDNLTQNVAIDAELGLEHRSSSDSNTHCIGTGSTWIIHCYQRLSGRQEGTHRIDLHTPCRCDIVSRIHRLHCVERQKVGFAREKSTLHTFLSLVNEQGNEQAQALSAQV